jgi:hypothetical protein
VIRYDEQRELGLSFVLCRSPRLPTVIADDDDDDGDTAVEVEDFDEVNDAVDEEVAVVDADAVVDDCIDNSDVPNDRA